MDKINQLLSLQEDKYEQIKKAQTNYGKSPKTRISASYLDTRMENLEKTWQMFRSTHDNIIASVTREQKSALKYFSDEVYEQCEEVYTLYKSELKAKLKELVPKKEHQSALNTNSTAAEIKLPMINIPSFTGRYTEWQSFYDLFSSLIHNNKTIDDVQKLHYLKCSLSGEAEQLLRSVSVTSQNYNLAWETLKNRYSNKRYISNCIFKKLFGIRSIATESSLLIKQLLDTTTECLSSLSNLGLPTTSWDTIIIYITVSKLDTESHKLWEQHISLESDEFPKLETLKQFLQTRFRTLEIIEHTSKTVKHKTFHTAVEPFICALCGESHHLYQCKVFTKKSITDKREYAVNKNLCFNCLIPNHTAKFCKRNTQCRICHKKHHSLLHPEKRELISGESHKDQSNQSIVSHFVNQPGQILLATALVDVASRQGQLHIYRALIDQGSQASFVTEELVQTSGLKRVKINGKVSGLSEGSQLCIKYMVEVKIQARNNPHFTVHVNAYVLKTITNYLPTQQITVSNWPELEQLTLADPYYHTPNKISMLLGADVYSKIIDTGLLKGPTGIIAQSTHLGWILSGDTNKTKPEKEKQIINMHICSNENELLKRFWEIENEILNSERKLTKEEERCEEIYKTTTVRTKEGRYKVNLPFKDNSKTPVEICGRTKETATARFLQLEKRFNHDTTLKEEYTHVIREYQELNHMSLAEDNMENVLYLPHHAVIRNDKDTSKVRVVYDGSSKGSKGYSLNDTLLVGPVLQKDLRTLIMEWRQHKIVIISDIVKMYRQVLVSDEHAEYQRIIWRDNPQDELKSYKLLTVTFGTASAPYLAVRTLQQVADDEKHKYPLGAEILKGSFYMDDLMAGGDSEEQAIDIYREVKEILKSAGFEMQKWSSNSNEVLDKISETTNERKNYEIKFDKIIKILGLRWDRQDDKFKFFVDLPETSSPITKRLILSDVARLFDPFGWLAPTIIRAKVFIQKLWLCNAAWDEELPLNLKEEWLNYRHKLHQLKDIQLERWIHTNLDNNLVEIHGFADASTTAYAAVLYMRVVQNNEVFVTILESKTKVAPLKQISVARLELCAAVLLSRLLAEAANTLKILKHCVFAYTDSSVVLSWIQAQPIKWQTFVANRVTEIQNRLDNDRWNHVPSEENPADMASRGVDPADLKENELWWNGPYWLKQKVINRKKKWVPETKLEERKIHTKIFHYGDSQYIWEKFSDLNKMIRVLTYCRRLLRLKTKKEIRKEQNGYLTTKEMNETLNSCIKFYQEEHFSKEITDLKENKYIKKKSKLINLTPYLDEDYLLRVGGRLQAAKIPAEVKHPIIIPYKSHIARLLIKDAHHKLLHGGTALMMNYLRSRYWVLGLKPMVKKYLRQCLTCLRYRANVSQPQMGELPAVRINPGKPFRSTGVDFAGPIQMRFSKGRGQKSYKGYICLFICMTTKAIHLEAVSDLTTQGFMAAFRRFVSRRGLCRDMYSDNGLNFVGAAKELLKLFSLSKDSSLPEIVEQLENDGTTWHFIPPRAPNFGGLWEAGIKSVKTHLTKVIGNSTLTFEEISTLLCQIEACLNSRPICQLNEDPTDLAPLTPAHFLLGEPTRLIPEENYKQAVISPLNRWRMVQRMTNHFWVRWSKEFLHTMQQRHKWHNKTRPPKIDDVVIVKDADVPPSKWLLARIVDLHPGPDGNVRVVTLKCKRSTLKRPLSKLIFLPQDETPKDGLIKLSKA